MSTRRTVGLLSLLALASCSRAEQDAPPPVADIRAAAFDAMTAARYATLVTLGADGHPQARVVDPLLTRGGDTIWIGTNPLTRKVEEIRRDPRVTLLFFNAAAAEYVTVLGHAVIVTDSAERAAHWKAEWTPFYPERERDRNFALIAVRPFRLEVSSPSRGLANDPRTWRPVVLDIP